MTREDAINIMKVIVHMLEEKYDTDRVEDAVDMAIKALEQEPILDKIRADIIDLSEGWNGMQAKDVPLGAVLKVIDKYKAESEDKE